MLQRSTRAAKRCLHLHQQKSSVQVICHEPNDGLAGRKNLARRDSHGKHTLLDVELTLDGEDGLEYGTRRLGRTAW
jgi:hypothetical protein